ncbi:cation:dicarboxylase symporter family transporter [bacterium]|nr:cation:dicarboxylase symporter family transporter [bacterium]
MRVERPRSATDAARGGLQPKEIMSDQSSQHLSYWIMVGIVLGALCGWFLPSVMLTVDFIGTLFLNALKIIVFPLIITTIVIGITTLGDYRKLGRTTLKTVGLFAATSGIAAAAGLVLALIFGPGKGVSVGSSPLPIEVMPSQLRSFGDFLTSLIPANLIEAADGGSYIGLVVVSILVGIVLITRGARGRTLLSFFKDLRDLLTKLLSWVMFVAPLGLGVLVGTVVANHRSSLLDMAVGSAMLMLVVVIGLLFMGIIVLPLVLRIYGQRSPVDYLSNMLPALWTAFGTASSSATFPATYDCVVNRNDVDERAGSFVLPLSMSLNMNGSALYLAAAGVFVAQAAGLSLSILQIIQLFVGSVIVSMALGGVPSAALWGVIAVASIAGFPREAMAAFAALLVVDWIVDRIRTVVNVTGDGVSAAVIAETFEFKTVGQRGARMAGERNRATRRDPRTSRSGPDRPDRRSGRGRDQDRDRKPPIGRGRRTDSPPTPVQDRPSAPTERSDRDDRRSRRRPERTGDDSQRDNRRGRRESGPRRPERGPRDDNRRGAPDNRRERRDRSDERETVRADKAESRSAARQDAPPEKPEAQVPVEETRITSRLTPIPSFDSDPVVQPQADTKPEVEQPDETNAAERPGNGRSFEGRAPRVRRRELKPRRSPKPEDENSSETESVTAQESPPKEETLPGRASEPEAKPPVDQAPTPPKVVEQAEAAPTEAKRERDDAAGRESASETADNEPEQKTVSYGRSRARKGRATAAQKSSETEVGPVVADTDQEDQPEPEGSYSNENVSFGRGKRKRIR